MNWPEVLGGLVRGEDLSAEAAAWAMEQILGGEATPAQLAAFAVGLRSKGETVAELTGLADVMLDFATPIEVAGPGGRRRRVRRGPREHGQHLDHGRDRGGGRRRPGGQARQSGRFIGVRSR